MNTLIKLYERYTKRCWHKWKVENAFWDRYECTKCKEKIRGR